MVVRVPFTGDEKQSLRVSLDRHRDAVLWKLEGLGDDDLRRAMTPSGTNLLGLVKHLAAVEYGWFCDTFGRPTEPLPFDDDDPDADLRVRPDETTEDVLAFYGRARAAADKAIDELELEATGTAWFGDAVSMRWVLIHMIEETARHAGHVDIIRELDRRDDRGPPARVTGRAGPRPGRPAQPLAAPAPAGWRSPSGVGVWAPAEGPAALAMPSRSMWITNSTIEPIRNRMLGRYGLPGSR